MAMQRPWQRIEFCGRHFHKLVGTDSARCCSCLLERNLFEPDGANWVRIEEIACRRLFDSPNSRRPRHRAGAVTVDCRYLMGQQ